jgi:hypothetical protein
MNLFKYNFQVLSVSVSDYTDEFGVLRDSFFWLRDACVRYQASGVARGRRLSCNWAMA